MINLDQRKSFKLSFNLCIILMTLFCLLRIYRNSYGYASTQVGGLWNYISVIFVGFALLVLFGLVYNKEKLPTSIKLLVIYSFTAILNCLFHMSSLSINSIYYLCMIAFYPAVVIVFFNLGQRTLTKQNRILIAVSFFAICLLSIASMIGFRTGTLEFVMVSNAYFPLCFLPIIIFVFIDNAVIKNISFVVVGIVLFLSTKRTGVLAFLAFLFCVLFFDAFLKNKLVGFFKGLFKVIFSIGILLVIYLLFKEQYDLNLFERFLLLEEDGGSGRDEMYAKIIDAVLNSNIIDLFFGHGFGSVADVLKNHSASHNDFLEIIYEYGLVPFLMFILHYICLVKTSIKSFKNRDPYCGLIIGSIFLFLFLSMFSTYCIGFSYVICGAAFLGLILGKMSSDSL